MKALIYSVTIDKGMKAPPVAFTGKRGAKECYYVSDKRKTRGN
jgi:hypothetical protein